MKPYVCRLCGKTLERDYEAENNQETNDQILKCPSCGNRLISMTLQESVETSDEINKTHERSHEKIREKPKFERENKIGKNDQDNPKRNVRKEYIKTRDQESTKVLQIIYYEDNLELKHIHCKNCNNEWNYQNGEKISGKFEHIEILSFKCLGCNTQYYR